MKLEQIKKSVDEGKLVFFKNPKYRVIKDDLGQYLIKFIPNNSVIGLTDKKGFLTQDEKNFYTITFKPVIPIFNQ
jgi:hypothetical protein